MFRSSVLWAFFALVAVGAASAQDTPPGEPNSPDRQAYCQAQQSQCLRQHRTLCARFPIGQPSHRLCVDELQHSCTKDFQICLEAGAPPTNPAPQPAAASGCTTLFSNMLAYARENQLHRVHVVWTTNYFANGTRFGAVSSVMLRAQRRVELVGEGERRRTFFGGHHVEVENVSLLFRRARDYEVVLQGIYGPYPITCTDNKFAVATTGDSVETFNFKFPPH